MNARSSLMRLLSLLTLIGGLLSACEPTSDQPSEAGAGLRPLVLWHAYRGEEASALLASLKRFESEQGRAVRTLQLPHQAFNNKLLAAIPRGNGPDLWIGAHDRVGDYAEAGLIEPVGYWMSEALAAQLFPRTLEALSYSGNLYGLPLSFKTLVLYYRQDLTPQPPQTLPELKQMAQSFKAAQPSSRWGLAVPELDSLYFHAPWLHAHGGVAERMSESRADQEALLASVATVKSLLDEGYIPPELNGALTASLFRAGELAFVINGPWFKGDLEGLEAPWRVAPLPALKADGSAALSPYLGVEGVFISSHAQDKSGAWELAQELASERAARAALERGVLVAHRVPYQAEASPALKAWRQAFERQLDHVEPLSNRPEMKRLWTPLKRMLSSSLLFGKDPQESLTEALRAIEELAR